MAFITKGTVGRVGSVRDDQPAVVFAPQVCYWRSLDADLLDARFLFYLLSGQQFQANLDAVKTHGSMAADYVSITDQQSFLLDLPPIEDQRAISEIGGSRDEPADVRWNPRRQVRWSVEGLRSVGGAAVRHRDQSDAMGLGILDGATLITTRCEHHPLVGPDGPYTIPEHLDELALDTSFVVLALHQHQELHSESFESSSDVDLVGPIRHRDPLETLDPELCQARA